MILPDYISCQWLQNSFDLWNQKCKNARDAETIEILYEVLYISSLLYLAFFPFTVCALGGVQPEA